MCHIADIGLLKTADHQRQPRLRDSHDTLVGDRPARFREASAGFFDNVPVEEMDAKTNNRKSSQDVDSDPASPSTEDTDRDIEKEAEAPVFTATKDKRPEDTNLVVFDGPDDPGNPQNFSKGKKWMITILLSFMTLTITFSSTIFSTAILVVSEKFHVGTEVAILGVSWVLIIVRHPQLR